MKALILFEYEIIETDPTISAFVIFNLQKIVININFIKECLEKINSEINDKNICEILKIIIFHEIFHFIKYDHKRLIKKDIIKHLANIAKDIEINILLDLLNKECKYTNIDTEEMFSETGAYDKKYENWPCEKIYDDIMKDAKIIQNQTFELDLDTGEMKPIDNNDQNSNNNQKDKKDEKNKANNKNDKNKQDKKNNNENGSNQDNNKIKVKITNIKYKLNGKDCEHTDIEVLNNKVTQNDNDKNNDQNNKEKDDENKKIEEIKRALRQSLKQKGELSDKIYLKIQELLFADIPWDEILQEMIKNVIPEKDEISWNKYRNIVYVMPNIPPLPGEMNREIMDTIIICQDESGSIDLDDRKRFLDIIIKCKDRFQNMIIIRHDIDIITEIYENIENLSDDQIDEISKNKLCGGTSHQKVFEEIEKIHNENHYEISGIFFLTDLYSDILEHYKKIENISVPKFWICAPECNEDVFKNLKDYKIKIKKEV